MSTNKKTPGNNYHASLLLTIFIAGSVAVSAAAADGRLTGIGRTKQGQTVPPAAQSAKPGTKTNNAVAENFYPQPAITPRGQTMPIFASADKPLLSASAEAEAPAIVSAKITVPSLPALTTAPAATTTASTTPVGTTVFTAQMLAQHNKAGDCYVAYQGKVYNVSGQSVWGTCNYSGITGGADVTANFPNASYYFTGFPQMGSYTAPQIAANTVVNNTNNVNNTATNNTHTASSSALSNANAAAKTAATNNSGSPAATVVHYPGSGSGSGNTNVSPGNTRANASAATTVTYPGTKRSGKNSDD